MVPLFYHTPLWMTINNDRGGGVQTCPGVCVCVCVCVCGIDTCRSLSRGHLQVCRGRGDILSRLRGGWGGAY